MYVETSNKAHSITSPVLSPISTPSVSRRCVGSSPGRGLLLIGLSLCRFGPAEVGWSLNCQQWSFLHASTKMLLWSLALYVQYHQECLWPWCLIPCMTQTTMPPPGSPIPSPAKCSSSTSTFQKNMLNLSEILQATADLLHYSMCIWPLCNPVQKANLRSVTWGTQKGLWHPVKKKYIYNLCNSGDEHQYCSKQGGVEQGVGSGQNITMWTEQATEKQPNYSSSDV